MFERTLAAEDQALFVADVEGEIAGYARIVHLLGRDAPADAAPAGYYLMGLAVGIAWRRRGLAEALTKARLSWAWSRTDRVYYFASAEPRLAGPAPQARLREVSRSFSFPGVDFAGGVGGALRLERPTG